MHRLIPLCLALPVAACTSSPSSHTAGGTSETGPAATEGDPCTPDAARAQLSLGKGEVAYEPMDAGDGSIELIHGPQGGYHITLALEGRFLDSSEPSVAEIVGSIEGEQLARSVPYVEWRCNPEAGALQAWNLLLIYDAQPEELDGQLTQVQATLTDAAGTVVDASAEVQIHDPLLH